MDLWDIIVTFARLLVKDNKMKRRKIRKGCLARLVIVAIMTIVGIIMCVKSCTGNKDDKIDSEPLETIKHKDEIDTSLVARLKDFSLRPRPEGQFAFHVYDITADKPVFGCNDSLALPSASCMKLLSGIAGLRLLGGNYHYWTAIFSRGNVASDGTLNGDISFRAGLDPQLLAPDLNAFAKAVKKKGIKRFSGKLIIDLAITEPVKSEEHWFPWDLTFSKYGLFYKGKDRVVKAIKASLRGQGITVKDEQIVMAKVPKGSKCLYITRRFIDDVIKRMWKNSSNTQATAMLYTIGKTVNPQGDPVTSGVDYLRSFLTDSLSLTNPSLCIHDGCGLCTHNCLSPLALTTILRYGYHDKNIRASLNRNLSIAGIDGTLMREMGGPKLRGKIRAKTGTLSHPYGISSLAGFCEGANGHTLAFAIMDSEMAVLDARVLQRKLCEILVKE